MAIDRAPRRIKALEPMASEDIDKFRVPSSQEPTAKGKAENWHLPIDYSNADTSENADTEDFGTMRIPVSRIALRDANGLIPSTMLPSYVDDVMYGTMDITDPTKAVFTVVDKDEHMVATYTSPVPQGGVTPPDNIVFYDKTTNLQYRYIEHSGTAPYFDFTIVPGSRAISTTYGINITEVNNNTGIQIDAKKPRAFIKRGNGSIFDITGSNSGIGTGFASVGYSYLLTVNSVSNKFTVGNLIERTSDPDTGELSDSLSLQYHIIIELGCYPSVKSDDIIKLHMTYNGFGGSDPALGYAAATVDYDMSSTATAGNEDTVMLSCVFNVESGSKEFYIWGEPNFTVKAKLNRISVVELL